MEMRPITKNGSTENVQKRQHRREPQDRGRPQNAAAQRRDGGLEVDEEEDGVQRVVDDAAEPLHPALLEPPVGAERRGHPHHVPAVLREHGAQLRRDQRLRHAPDEREDQEASDGEERARRAHAALDAERPAGDLVEDYEDERDDGQLGS
jgi:hypothetical protein